MGIDFRPHYALISKVTNYFNDAQVIALTATLTDKMFNDIEKSQIESSVTQRKFKS